jgi:segregation and condensation protein B
MGQTEVKAAPETEEQMQVEEQTEEVTEQFLAAEAAPAAEETADAQLKAILEALVYITDEPLSAAQIATTVARPVQTVTRLLEEIASEFNKPEHGLTIREVAGGYKMATKAEYHEPIRAFVKNLKPPLKLSLAALETLAVIAYKQPITAPEIMEIRGVQGAGVLKTLLDRKLIAAAGRKHVLGKPILYKTTKEFLIQFGLKDLSELPTLKEFEELGRFAFSDETPPPTAGAEEARVNAGAEEPAPEPVPEREPPSDPEPVREPEPPPEPVHEPDPGHTGDPQHEPVKAEPHAEPEGQDES